MKSRMTSEYFFLNCWLIKLKESFNALNYRNPSMLAGISDAIVDVGKKIVEFVRNYGAILGVASGLCAMVGYFISDINLATEARYAIITFVCFISLLVVISKIIFRVAPKYSLHCEGTQFYAEWASKATNAFFKRRGASVLRVEDYWKLVKCRPHCSYRSATGQTLAR
jgi:hypothetical protein